MKDFDTKFSNEYYVIDAIRLSEKYRKLKIEIRNNLNELGLPIPTDGFKSVKEFNDWTKKLALYGKSIKGLTDNIFKEFNLDYSNHILQLGVRDLLFFGSTGQFTPNIRYNSEFDNENNVYIDLKIYPQTTKEDLEKLELWKIIENIRKNGLKSFSKTKNKEWENFQRDLEIYNLFLLVERDIKKGLYKAVTTERKINSKSPYYQIQFYDQFFKIEEKFNLKEGTLANQIKTIVCRCKKFFGTMNIL